MKNLLTLALLVLSLSASVAQQQYTTSLYTINGYNINPAYAGLNNCVVGNLQYKNQWAGISNAPSNGLLQVHGQLNPGFGIGLTVDRWSAALLTSTQVGLSLAFHHQISEQFKLSVALNGGYAGFGFKAEDAVVFENDNTLSNQNQANGGVFSDLGILLSHNDFEVGIALPKMVAPKAEFEGSTKKAKLNINSYFILHGNYTYGINADLDIVPSVVYRSLTKGGGMMDLMGRVVYKKQCGIALGYRTRSGLLAGIDYRYNDMLRFGYTYDAGLSKFNKVSGGSHEVLVGISVCRKDKEPEEEAAPKVDYYIMGTVKNAEGQPLANNKVKVSNTTTGKDTTLTTDAEGMFTELLAPATGYKVTVSNDDFEPFESTFTSADSLVGNKDVAVAMVAKKVMYYGSIKDGKTKQPIKGVKVEMKNGTESYSSVSDKDGKIEFTLPKKREDQLLYDVSFHKEGYAPETDKLNTTVNNYEPKDLLKELKKADFVLKPFEEGADIAELIEILPIYFASGSAELNDASKQELNKVIQVMTENENMRVELGAHTDCTGNESANQALSQKRADACMQYIAGKITNPGRITGKGYGESKPLTNCKCNECSDEENAKNRRTEFKILGM